MINDEREVIEPQSFPEQNQTKEETQRAEADREQQIKNFQKPSSIDLKKVYLYDSKPKIVVWLKKAIGVIALASFLLFFTSNLIGLLWTNDEGSFSENFYGQNIIGSIRYLFPLIALFMVYYAFRQENYDRERYQFSLLYSILMVAYNSFWLVYIWRLEEDNLGFIDVWAVLKIINIIIIFLLLFAFILVNLMKPKIDPQKLFKFRKELAKKAKANLANEPYEMDLDGLE